MGTPVSAISLLSPQAWPFSLQWLPQSAYLVGGTVRDALLDRRADYLDLDFVLSEGAVETAQAIAHHYRAGFVLLDAERQIARVVFERATADFAQQEGSSLEIDLKRRDFTVNAIAYNPHSGELLDPLQGFNDLQQAWIRMVAPENLQEDPLRLLRAYRQASQLNFALEPETQTVIRQMVGLLAQVAAERVQTELGYLLSTFQGTAWLTTAWQDGLLQAWFPDATAEGLAQVAAIDRAAIALGEIWPDLGAELASEIRDSSKSRGKIRCAPTGGYRTWLTTAKLTNLLAAEPQTAEANLWRLKYSRAEIRAVVTVLKFLPQIQSVTSHTQLSRREQYFFFQGGGAVFPALAVLAVASGTEIAAIAPLIERYLTPNDPVAHPHSLLTGKDLMGALNLGAGPQIGQLLAAVQLAQAEGKVSTPEAALKFAAELIDSR